MDWYFPDWLDPELWRSRSGLNWIDIPLLLLLLLNSNQWKLKRRTSGGLSLTQLSGFFFFFSNRLVRSVQLPEPTCPGEQTVPVRTGGIVLPGRRGGGRGQRGDRARIIRAPVQAHWLNILQASKRGCFECQGEYELIDCHCDASLKFSPAVERHWQSPRSHNVTYGNCCRLARFSREGLLEGPKLDLKKIQTITLQTKRPNIHD